MSNPPVCLFIHYYGSHLCFDDDDYSVLYLKVQLCFIWWWISKDLGVKMSATAFTHLLWYWPSKVEGVKTSQLVRNYISHLLFDGHYRCESTRSFDLFSFYEINLGILNQMFAWDTKDIQVNIIMKSQRMVANLYIMLYECGNYFIFYISFLTYNINLYYVYSAKHWRKSFNI